LLFWDVVKPKKELDWFPRVTVVCDYVSHVVTERLKQEQVHVFIETPQFIGGSGRGYATAGSGDLVATAVLVGALARECGHLGVPCVLVPISWKGQLSKQVVQKRVMAALGLKETIIPNHAADATGMGLWLATKEGQPYATAHD